MILGSNITAGSGETRIDAFTNLGAVFNILSLVSDSVAGYDMDGNIILANENLANLCGLTRQQLIGTDVRNLLLPLSGVPGRHGQWPFTMDGSEVRLLCRRPTDGTLVPVAVRAKPLGETDCFILTVRACDSVQLPVELELPRADVVDILDVVADRNLHMAEAQSAANATSPANPGANPQAPAPEARPAAQTTESIHYRMANELKTAVDGEVAALYIAEGATFHLKSCIGLPAGLTMPLVIDQQNSPATLMLERSRSVGFDRLPKGTRADEAQGKTLLVDKRTSSAFAYAAAQVPPLTSFFMVPILFDTMAVGFCVVGWCRPRPLSGHDAKVLDMLASHQSSDLMTATASSLAASSELVQDLASDLWLELEQLGDKVTYDDYYHAFEHLAAAFGCELMPVYYANRRTKLKIDIPGQGFTDFPFFHESLLQDVKANGVIVHSPAAEDALSEWLLQLDQPRMGFVVDISSLSGQRRCFVVVRDATEEPFEPLEVTLFKRFVQDVQRADQKLNTRAQDTYISHTLQSGMGNTLQEVQGLTACAIYNSATEAANVGGDFYELINLPNRRACIILGDVAGKGVKSASISAAVRTSLGAYAYEGLMPAHMVRSLNDFFMSFSSLETFATLFVGVIDLETGQLTYCSAGHPPALMMHPAADNIELLNVQSGVVGAFREMIYTDGTIAMQPGDTLVLYTDGVTEARNPEGTFFGEMGLRNSLVRHMHDAAEQLPDCILDELYDFAESHLADDVAVMTVRLDALQTP